MKAIYVEKPGGPEVLKYMERPDPKPAADQVLVELKAIGVNFIDIYYRTGFYKTTMPTILGLEGAGIVIDIGKDVKDFKISDRVVYTDIFGSYAQKNVVSANRLIQLPKELSFKDGAAAMVQGITAHYLATTTYPLKKGDICLVHAAAGGVGLLLCQVAKLAGAIVIGTVSSEEKAALVKKIGADHAIVYSKKNFNTEVKNITDGKGVQVVYDSVGLSTFDKSLDCLAPRGMMVLFGQSSGAVPSFDLNILAQKGSLYITRPGISTYIMTREELLWRANDVFAWIIQGKLKLNINHEFPLARAAEAHMALEGRKTTGKILLIPNEL